MPRKMHMQRQSIDANSETSYCERDAWEDWESRSSLSHLEEVVSQGSHADELSSVRAERDALARALAGERARAASAARAHDARLAELHGVIAELVRRRAMDKHAGAIPEEDVSDECESTTQPAGELDHDADRSRSDQNESSSILSPCSLPTPQEKLDPQPDDTSASSLDLQLRLEQTRAQAPDALHDTEPSLHLSERGSEACLSARCCERADAGSSCEREHGSPDARVYTASPGRCESRQAKLASRVRLKRTDGGDCNHISTEQAAERLASDVCAQADLTEALLAANNDGEALSATLQVWRARCSRLQADCAVLQGALARAADTAHRLYLSCSVSEGACVGACLALRAADRALEAYDVLLALAETDAAPQSAERAAAERVAGQLLARLDAPAVTLGSPLLSPGPWLQHDHTGSTGRQAAAGARWGGAGSEARLRAHAAALKADTVSLRPKRTTLFSYHDIEEEDIPKSAGNFNMAEMEAAVAMQEVLAAKEAIATAHARCLQTNTHSQTSKHTHTPKDVDTEHKGSRRRRRHWLHTQASETDL